MKWYRKLYIGENAKKDKYKVFGHIRKNRFCADTFLITLASNTCNMAYSSILKDNDNILIKASHAMKFADIVELLSKDN